MTGEQEPQLSIEERVLTQLGYAHRLDTPLGEGITGRNFLDLYKSPEKREETEDQLYGFAGMSPDDPGYENAKTYIMRFVEAYFGPPQAG